MRDEFGLIPHFYFDWTEGSPLMHFLRFILWGPGEVAPVTREILRHRELQACHFPGGATLAKMAWPSSAGLVNCGQWPVGRSM
jgi:hypothetical protein